MQECYGGSFSFRVICSSLVVRIDAASRPITIHRTTITPLGYIPAHHIFLSPSPSRFLSLSLSLARARALPRSSLFLLTFFSTCLITNSQAYLSRFAWEKLPGFELLRVTPLFLARLELLFVIPPAEIQIILGGANCYLLAVCISNIFRSLYSAILTPSQIVRGFLSFSLLLARSHFFSFFTSSFQSSEIFRRNLLLAAVSSVYTSLFCVFCWF